MSNTTKNRLNITLPTDLVNQLYFLCERMNSTKKEITVNALRQYIAIKTRELDYIEEGTKEQISTEAILKLWLDKDRKSIATVMIY